MRGQRDESGVADLQFVHYQYEGFEHYDVIHLEGKAIGLAAAKKNAVMSAMRDSVLLNALQANDTQEYRRLAFGNGWHCDGGRHGRRV